MTKKFMFAEHIVCRKTNGELCMLFDRDKGVMYEMNETASAIIEQLSRAPASADELSQALEREYDGSPEEIKDDVQHLLADFADAGLVRSTDRK